MIIENKAYTGEDIENLNSIASDHLFMHAMQKQMIAMVYKCIKMAKDVG